MNKKYNIIYADPPWTFKTYSEKGKEKKSPELHYNCMTLKNIYSLPVQVIAEDNSVLFLWVTNPLLQEGLECIKKWGFIYKTVGFTWYKKNKVANSMFFGLGYWTRANTELCLLATKGNPKRVDKGVSQVVENFDLDFEYCHNDQVYTAIREHSRKPDEIREKIVKLCGDLPRVELFARHEIEGWDAWGDQVSNSIAFNVS
jgi:N6-adenosine-specific RNA methylase IME4